MTREQIIEMARDAGFNVEQGFLLRVTGIDEDLERFAALVAAAEREECAKLAREYAKTNSDSDVIRFGFLHLAGTIRARGETQ